jgi:hypothetical protein
VVSAEEAVPSRIRFSTKSIASEIIWFSLASGVSAGLIAGRSAPEVFLAPISGTILSVKFRQISFAFSSARFWFTRHCWRFFVFCKVCHE